MIEARTAIQADWIRNLPPLLEPEEVIEESQFVGGPGGQDLRDGGKWERATNVQQRKLVRAFDSWSKGLTNSLIKASEGGASAGELATILDSQLPALESEMVAIGRQGMLDAESLVTGKRVIGPQISATTNAMIAKNNELVREGLIPGIRLRILGEIDRQNQLVTGSILQSGPRANRFRDIIKLLRVRPAQYAGGFWAAIFEVQKAVGIETEAARIARGLKPEPVRWVLDPQAEHCEDSADGFRGCPTQAGEYPGGWSTLEMVPAGQVTCRGNCRCIIEVFTGGEWRRGAKIQTALSGPTINDVTPTKPLISKPKSKRRRRLGQNGPRFVEDEEEDKDE